MAYISKEKTAEKKVLLNGWCKKWKTKATLKRRDCNAITATIREGNFPFNSGYKTVAPAWYRCRTTKETDRFKTVLDHTGSEMWKELEEILMSGNHDNSDLMTDYYDVGWYVYVAFGNYEKPYIHVK